jgi:hypothetical protein
MRSQTYAKALPMPYVEGCRKRLEMIKQMPELRSKLWENVKAMQDGLRSRGFNIGETESPVTPVFLHSEGGVPEVTRMVRDLRENMGVFCSIVVYPVVPKGQIMLRIIPTASHTLEGIYAECFYHTRRETQKQSLPERRRAGSCRIVIKPLFLRAEGFFLRSPLFYCPSRNKSYRM